MTGVFILLGGMAAFAVIITAWDQIAQRHNRRHPTPGVPGPAEAGHYHRDAT